MPGSSGRRNVVLMAPRTGIRRLAFVLIAVGCVVVAAAVLVFRAAITPNPGPSLGPAVHVTSHPGSPATRHPSPTDDAADDDDADDDDDDDDADDDGGASPLPARTPAHAGDEDGPDGDDDPYDADEPDED